MTIVVSQLAEPLLKYSFLEINHYGYLSKAALVSKAAEFKQSKHSIRLPGQKKPKETSYFYKNALALGTYALEKADELDDDVVAILFRDSDGTASADRGVWDDKRNAMLQGFVDAGYLNGVPMIPKPKSEAWVICALKQNPYSGCNALEARSGNDNSPKSLKKELAGLHGSHPSREELCQMVTERTIDATRINMPSFQAFRDRLNAVMQSL
jgi:hypothetical protein